MAGITDSNTQFPAGDIASALDVLARLHDAFDERRGPQAVARLLQEAEPYARRRKELAARVEAAARDLRAAAPEFSTDIRFDGFRWRRLRSKGRSVVTLVGQRIDQPGETIHCVFYDDQARDLLTALGAPRTERDLDGPVRLRITGRFERTRSSDSMGRTILFEDMVVTNFELLDLTHLPDLPDYDKAAL